MRLKSLLICLMCVRTFDCAAFADDRFPRSVYYISEGGSVLTVCDGKLYFAGAAADQSQRPESRLRVESKKFLWKDDYIRVFLLPSDRGKLAAHDEAGDKYLTVDFAVKPPHVHLTADKAKVVAWRMDIERESPSAITASIAAITSGQDEGIWLAWESDGIQVISPEGGSVMTLRRPILVTKERRKIFKIGRYGGEDSGK